MPVGAYSQGLLTPIINLHWAIKACRFAVIGYDGQFIDRYTPVYFGTGAYSDDGKSWTNFKVFQNGAAASVFNMIAGSKNLIVAGGCTNQESFPATSTAELTTVVGSGVSASGGTSNGRNVAGFFNLGYDRDKGTFYAVEVSGEQAATSRLHTFQIREPKPPDSKPPDKPSIVWAGAHYPGIGPVYDCTCVAEGFTGSDPLGGTGMTFEGQDGKKHTLNIGLFGTDTIQLHLDGADITPPGSRSIVSAAGGMNGGGENIIIATGYSRKGDKDQGTAWWSIDGTSWTEITGIWTGEPELQAAAMATAVPNS